MEIANFSWSKIPKRFNIAVMVFFACLISFMLDVVLSISMIAMVSPTAANLTQETPDYGPRRNWTQQDQGHLLGAFFYGFIVTSLPAGMLAENFGGKLVAGYSCLLAAILTALMPWAVSSGKLAVWILRFSIGLCTGTIYPSSCYLISNWSPPTERGKFVFALMGNNFGTMITWPICGIIIEHFGWYWVYYFVAVFVAFFCCVWFLLVVDTPAKHPTISENEREMIHQSLGNTVSDKKRWPPYRSLLLSLPFWGLLLLHFGNMWGLFFLLTASPKFLTEVLGFDLSSSSFFSSLPHMSRLIFAFGFGSLADFIIRRKWMSVTRMRKLFCLPSHILPGIFLIVLALFGRDPYVCVAFMTISLAFNGASTVTNGPNAQDLAPNFAGTLFGIIDCIGMTSGILSPMLVVAFTNERNTLDEWFWIFLIGAGAYILPALLFCVIGSGEIQKWNELKTRSAKADISSTKM